MAWTLGDIVSTTQTEIKDSAISSTTLKEWYNDTVRELSLSKKWRFFEASQAYTLVASTADIANGGGLPSNYQVANSFHLTTSSFEGKLTWIDFKDLMDQYPAFNSAADSSPNYIYDYGGVLSVFPKPDIAYTGTLYYQKIPTTQTSDSDAPEFTEDFREVIKLGIRKRFYLYRDKEDKAQLVQQQIDDLMPDLARRYAIKQIGQIKRMRQANRSGKLVRG